jgi:hypothetical protein
MLITAAALAGVLLTLFGIYIAQRTGFLQISIMSKAHELNAKLATCQIGTTCRIELRFPSPGRPDVGRYFIIASLYNTGKLAAKKLKGNCKLSCSESIHDRTIPIIWDSLGDRPYELDPQEFGGNAITQAIQSGNARINVDIQFDFLGLDDDTPEHYNAQYEYKHEQRQMVRI